jgi:hypothetical protein
LVVKVKDMGRAIRAGVGLSVVFLGVATLASAQTTVEPFEILDNSFLVEEAFNQERGIFQNIVNVTVADDEWALAFTQEWPLGSQRHQLSYTLLGVGLEGREGFGDALVHYRYQAMMEGPGRPAFAPRVSLILPTGRERDGLGDGVTGLQVNLPFSKQRGDIYLHWNAGLTLLPGVETEIGPGDQGEVTLLTPHLAGSAIWRVRPLLNLMLESLVLFSERVEGPGLTERNTITTISPGVRGGWNLGEAQLILGAAVPVAFQSGDTGVGAFGYFSYELPFSK